MSAVMHDYPPKGRPTSCCDRTSDELPLGDGRTSNPKGVTCDGTFTPPVWAHEIYPHPSDRSDEVPTLDEAAKYHAARALALTSDDLDHPGWNERLVHMLAERQTAWHVAALRKGLSGQDALAWVHAYSGDDSQECLYDLCVSLEVELHRIKPYPLRDRRSSATPTSDGAA